MYNHTILLVACIKPRSKETNALNLTEIQNIASCLQCVKEPETNGYEPYFQALDDRIIKGFVAADMDIPDLMKIKETAKFLAYCGEIEEKTNNPRTILIFNNTATEAQKDIYPHNFKGSLYAATVQPSLDDDPENCNLENITRVANRIHTYSNNVIQIHTPIGVLKAYAYDIVDEPTICVTVHLSDCENEADLLSAGLKLCENPHNKQLSLLVYGDPTNEEYTQKIDLDTEVLKQSLKESE